MKEKKHINEFHENSGSNHLLKAHIIGDLRDEADLDNAKYHAQQTAAFAKDIILNIEGTNQEKADFLDKVINDLDKFFVSKANKK